MAVIRMRFALRLAALFFLASPLWAQAESMLETIKGMPAPQASHTLKGAIGYVYEHFLVLAAPCQEEVGENITVYRRPADIPAQGSFPWKKLPPWFQIVEADTLGNYFAGSAGNALLVISQTGPDAGLSIYDLKTKRKVFGSGFRSDSARFINGQLQFQAEMKSNLLKLTPSEAKKFPDVAKWVAEGGSAGWFREVSIDLWTFKQSYIGQEELFPMQ
jgi:hypothetical protein